MSNPNPSATPERSLAQRRAALARGNQIRSLRAQMKRDLKAGRVGIVGLLLDPPEWLLTAKTYDLLVATPAWGRVKANRALLTCRISPSKTVGGLTDRQRDELAGHLASVQGDRAYAHAA